MGRETDLIIDDDVYRSTCMKTTGLGHLKSFHDHPLTRECRIAMDHERDHKIARVVPAPILARPNRSLNDRADDFEMRRVESQGHVHFSANSLNVGRESLVVFDVSCPIPFRCFSVELIEQVRRLLSEDVNQDIQPTSMRHADNGFHDTM